MSRAALRGDGGAGRWVEDPAGGLPVYRLSPSSDEHRALHAFGNWRATAVACDGGWIRVFEPSRGARWLQRAAGERTPYGGGAAWLQRTRGSVATVGAVEIELGAAWLRKCVRTEALEVEQVLFMPDGDDPVVLSLLTARGEPGRLRIGDYWGLHPEVLPFRVPRRLRRMLGRGRRWDFAFTRGRIEARPPAARLDASRVHRVGIHDHTIALVALSTEPVAGCADPHAWFGGTGSTRSAALDGLSGAILPTRPRVPACLALVTDVAVATGDDLHHATGFAWGTTAEIDALVDRYRGRVPEAWSSTRERWRSRAPRFVIPDHPWAARETAWSGVQLAQATIYDEYYEAHRITQGGNYLFVNGLDAAPRDLCQHAIAALHVDPWLSLETVRTVCRVQRADGALPWDLSGYGARDLIPFRPSDLDLWLLWAAAETLLATRDPAPLEEVLPFHPRHGGAGATLREHLAVALRHFRDVVGTGRHGLPRLAFGDWNDEILLLNPAPLSLVRTIRAGESTFNGALAVHALDRYGELLAWLGATDELREVVALREAIAAALRRAFTGRWLNRAWVGNEVEVGRDELYLEPQVYALLAGALPEAHARTLIEEIQTRLRDRSPIGAAICTSPARHRSSAPGTLENGGVWFAISGPLVMGLARYDVEAAFDEWVKSSLARHADAYPDRWFGIWSAPDSFNSFLSDDPGGTWVGRVPILGIEVLSARRWPILNAHAHGWPLAAAAHLAGFSAGAAGYAFTPRLPERILRAGFAWNGQPWSLRWSHDEVRGHVTPQGGAPLTIRVAVPSDWNAASATVDGESVAVGRGDDGCVVVETCARHGRRLPFTMRRA